MTDKQADRLWMASAFIAYDNVLDLIELTQEEISAQCDALTDKERAAMLEMADKIAASVKQRKTAIKASLAKQMP